MSSFEEAEGPIAVGGVGGSGTRVMADLLMGLGVFVGNDLNGSNDNMSWPPFKALVQESEASPEVKLGIARGYLDAFREGMRRGFAAEGRVATRWGWKVPTTFLHFDFLCDSFPSLRYIHLMRHGLDMVYSRNQNQLRNWGRHLGIRAEEHPPPVASLRYWIAANRFAISECESRLPGRFLLLRFEDLCREPGPTLERVAGFIGATPGAQDLSLLARRVEPPSSLGRYREHDLSIFSKTDLDAVRELGFPV